MLREKFKTLQDLDSCELDVFTKNSQLKIHINDESEFFHLVEIIYVDE